MNKMINEIRYIPGVHCPACEDNLLHPNKARNSSSRFYDAYICSTCGVKEAFNGFFWKKNALKRGLELKE